MTLFFTQKDKKITGFYDDKIHGDNIPDDAIEISEAHHQSLLKKQGEGAALVVIDNEAQATFETEGLPVIKNKLLRLINFKVDQSINAMKSTYPKSEIQSWQTQELEAVAFINDSTINTPLLNIIAEQRGIDVELLAQKVLIKSNIFKQFAGSMIGLRQRLEDELLIAEDIDTVNAIDASQISALSELLSNNL